MRVLIAGIDGYLGWALARRLAERTDEVGGIDAMYRRSWVAEVGGDSVVPIATFAERETSLRRATGAPIHTWSADLRDIDRVREVVRDFAPDALVHLGECPSAPYSMIDADHAVYVQVNNLTATFNLLFAVREFVPTCHVIKLGTLGEYGAPGVPIPEGFARLSYKGASATMPFPRQAASWYHWSKVHGSNNLMFATRLWGLRATDVMQGVVYGAYGPATDDPALATRLDVDAVFGTVVHRWCAQAVLGTPLTVYGSGSQRRGFIPLDDAVRCLTLLLDAPPALGEYRVVNQYQRVYELADLAKLVILAAERLGITATAQSIQNPRKEPEHHPYEVECDRLPALGYRPQASLDGELERLLEHMVRWRGRLEKVAAVLRPEVMWTTQPHSETTSHA